MKVADPKAFLFRFTTLRYRHKEAFEFFLLNFVLQLIPFGISLLEYLTNRAALDIPTMMEAAWSLLAFGLWNAPAMIRRHVTHPERTIRIRILLYCFAFIVTFMIFWIMFDQSDTAVSSPLPLAYLALPLSLALIACLVVALINFSLLMPVSVRLLWHHQAQFSGVYVAKYFGIFATQGLQVEIEPADPSVTNSALDRFGGNNFGIVSSTDIIKARASGNKIRAVLVIVPEPAISFMTKVDSVIGTFADFKGARVAYREGYEESDILRIMLHRDGLTVDDVTSVKGGVYCEEFIRGDADVVAGHEAIEPLHLAHEQVYVRTIPALLDEHPVFADTLATNEQTIRVMPDVVRGMVAGTSAGWKMATEYPARGIRATLYEQKDFSTKNRDFQSQIQNAMLGLRGANSSATNHLLPFGMKEADWEPIITAMEAAGLVRRGLRGDEMYWY